MGSVVALVNGDDADDGELGKTVYAIPTGNLASMAFVSSCDTNAKADVGGPRVEGGSGDRKYARPYFRHDAGGEGRPNTPKCLKYLGSTALMHFLMDAEDMSENVRATTTRSSPIDRGGREDPAGMRPGEGTTCELVTWVGPFPLGEAIIGEGDDVNNADGAECGSVLGEDRLGKSVHVSGSVGALRRRVEERLQGVVAERVILVGRADSRRVYNDDFRSNFGLAQARANWALGQLRTGQSVVRLLEEGTHILSIVGGPAHPGVDASICDRGVEIHMCWNRDNLCSQGDASDGDCGEAYK